MPRFFSWLLFPTARAPVVALAVLGTAAIGTAQAQPQPQTQPSMRSAARSGAGDLGGYRQILADAVAETFKKKYATAAFQAGLLRTARAPQPGDYAVCLQTIENGRIAYFAAFITGSEVETIRRAVAIDRCWLETDYSLLPPGRLPKQKKPWQRQSAR